jgi:hypothetical protein
MIDRQGARLRGVGGDQEFLKRHFGAGGRRGGRIGRPVPVCGRKVSTDAGPLFKELDSLIAFPDPIEDHHRGSLAFAGAGAMPLVYAF